MVKQLKNLLSEANEPAQEKSLSKDQLLKYAKDLSRLYRNELDHRKELEAINRELEKEILERTKLQTELARSEKRYRSLFEDSFDAIFITSADDILIDANDAYWELFGYEREELLGNTVLVTYADPSRRNVFQKAIDKAGAIKNFLVLARKKDGTEIECLISAVVRRGADGSIAGYQGIIRDITVQKRNRQMLELAKRMEALAHMAGGIAHEIRNPLAISSSATQLLLNDKTSPDQRKECAEKVLSGIDRASHIVENLLTFARPLRDHAIAEVDLAAVVLLTLKEINPLVVRQNVDVKEKISQDRISLIASAELLHQAFLNLLFNALAAMPDGGVLLVTVEANSSNAIVAFSDSGNGIPEEKMSRIFDPFFPGFSTSHGIGLGLSVAYTIVTQHGGNLWVESTVGRGTTFTVSLPWNSHSA